MSAAPLPGRPVRLGRGVAFVARPRAVAVGAILVLAGAALAVVAVGTGEIALSPREVVAALVGAGDPGTTFIVRDLRLPRVACAVLAGLALGVSGAVFQALTRNPLGSPDIVGFQQGAAVGALVVITVLGGSGRAVSAGALAGGAAVATAVYALARQGGRATGYRLILIGIAFAFLMTAGTEYLLARARVEDAQEGLRWLFGSLNGRTWQDALPLAVGLAVLLPCAVPAGRSLRALELGDDAAHGLGVRVERARIGLVALAVALVSVSTVAVGPIAFVALTAPQIARRLARAPAPPLVCSALTGAVLILAADIAAQRLIAGTPVPVGVMTGALGGLYLAWLLTHSWRSGHA